MCSGVLGEWSLDELLRFPFKDRESAQHLLIYTLIVLSSMVIPVIPLFFVVGYGVVLLRRIIRDGELELPSWSELEIGALLVDGVKGLLILGVYALPGLLMGMVGMGLYVGGVFLLSGGWFDRLTHSAPALSLFLVFGWMVLLGVCFFLVSGYLILCMIWSPLALARFAEQERFGAAFQVGQLWRLIRAHPWGFLGAVVVSYGLIFLFYTLFYSAGLLLCCLGPVLYLVTAGYQGVVATACFGVFYHAALRKVETKGE